VPASERILIELRSARRALRPVDRLLLAALAGISLVALGYHPRPGPFLLLFGALAVVVAGCAALGASSRAADVVHGFAPMADRKSVV
jgi:hypothetical protein